MKIVTVWESRMLCWTNIGENRERYPDTKIRPMRGFLFYLNREWAACASPGGEPIERKVLEHKGHYFMLSRPYHGEITEVPAHRDFIDILVFIGPASSDDRTSKHFRGPELPKADDPFWNEGD